MRVTGWGRRYAAWSPLTRGWLLSERSAEQLKFNVVFKTFSFADTSRIRFEVYLIIYVLPSTVGGGQLSRYSDSLRAGRSGDRIPVGARFSAPVQTGPEAHPASCTMGTGSFPGVRCGRGVTLTPHPLLVPRSKIE
jgi:hypothetical protein